MRHVTTVNLTNCEAKISAKFTVMNNATMRRFCALLRQYNLFICTIDLIRYECRILTRLYVRCARVRRLSSPRGIVGGENFQFLCEIQSRMCAIRNYFRAASSNLSETFPI